MSEDTFPSLPEIIDDAHARIEAEREAAPDDALVINRQAEVPYLLSQAIFGEPWPNIAYSANADDRDRARIIRGAMAALGVGQLEPLRESHLRRAADNLWAGDDARLRIDAVMGRLNASRIERAIGEKP